MPLNIPNHIAVILDGNRRYAEKRFHNRLLGHYYGARKLAEFVKWCRELGVKEITLYCFSLENFSRDEQEVSYLFNLFREQIQKYAYDKRISSSKVKVRFIGRLSLFPKDIQKDMNALMRKTKNNDEFIINFAVAYGGRAEIVDAVQKVVRKKIRSEKITEEVIRKELYLSHYPDLLIRTGEVRLSNFLLWQCAYAELIFLPHVLWPEFSKADFHFCLEEFTRRNRKFGR